MHLSVGGKSGGHAWSVRRQWNEGLRVQELFGVRSEPLNRCGQDKNTTDHGNTLKTILQLRKERSFMEAQ